MIEDLFKLPKCKYAVENEFIMLNYFIDNNILKYIVYGSDGDSIFIIDWVKSMYNVYPEFIIDENPRVKKIEGIDIIPFDIFEKQDNERYFVVVADEEYENPEYKKNLVSKLEKNGAVIIMNAHRVMRGIWSDWYKYIKENINGFRKLNDRLIDEKSKNTLYHYLKTYVTGKRYEGETTPLEYKYWGQEEENKFLFTINENECVLNLGGCWGDTVYLYLQNQYPLRKIISVEADDTNYNYLERNIGLLMDKDRSKVELVHCFIGEGNNTIDNLFLSDEPTLIEMDIEGGELDALHTGINTIKRFRPVLAICVYHKKEDLIEIPKYIDSIVDDYIFVLRKYPSGLFMGLHGIQQINELVLYAIPKERYIA